MEKTIATQNAERLGVLTTIFTLVNGLPTEPEVAKLLALAIVANIQKWYAENGKTYSPDTELIEEEAIKFAFNRVQEINDDAKATAMLMQMGAGSGLMN